MRRSNFKYLLVFLFLLLSVAASATPHDWYVSPSGSGTSCTSGSPCTVSTALGKLVTGNADTIHFANGIYSGDICIGSSCTGGTLGHGGVSGNASNRITLLCDGTTDADHTACHISGNNTSDGSAVIDVEASYITVQGFEMTGTSDAHGVFICWNGSGCAGVDYFYNNYVHNVSSISDCGSGGGAGIDTGQGFNTGQNRIIGNKIDTIGGGKNASCTTVQGIYIATPNDIIENNVVGNVAYAAIQQEHATANASTIANNTEYNSVYGIWLGNTSGGACPSNNIVTNNIVYGNTNYGIYQACSPSVAAVVTNNGCNGNGSGCSSISTTGTNTNTPLFTNYIAAGGGTYTLQSSSTYIDYSSTSVTHPTTDYLGNPRPDASESFVDIGAYEYQDTASSYTATVTASGNGTVTSTSSPTQATQFNCTHTGSGYTGTCSVSYPTGTQITLSESAGSGYTWSAWSTSNGGCSGAGTSCTFTPTASTTTTGTWTSSGCSISRVQYFTADLGTSGSSLAAAFTTSNVTTGNLIAVTVYYDAVAATVSVTDSNGNTYTRAIGPTASSSGLYAETWYAKNVTGGNKPTITVSTNGTTESDLRFAAIEYSGLSTTAPLDQKAGATGTTPTASSGSVTTTSACEVAVGFLVGDFGAWTSGSGWTDMVDWGLAEEVEEQMLTTTTTLAATGTAPSGTAAWDAQIVTFSGTAIATAQLTTVDSGQGTITSTDGYISCASGSGSCSHSYPSNTSVTLNEVPATNWIFIGWSGATCTQGTQSGSACTFTLTASGTVTATYSLPNYTLAPTLSGNGTITSNTIGATSLNCTHTGTSYTGTCSISVPNGTAVTLSESPGTGYTWSAWSGVTCSTGQTGSSCSFTMSSSATTPVATWTVSTALGISNHGVVHGTGSSVSTGTFNQALHDLLYVMCFSSTATATNTVSDTNGDSFVLLNSQKDTAFGSNWYNTWYASNVSARTGNNITCNFGSPSGSGTIAYLDITGASTISPLDTNSNVTLAESTSSCATPVINTANASDIIVAAVGNGQTGLANVALSTSLDFTVSDQYNINGTSGFYGADAIQTTSNTGAFSNSFSFPGNGGHSMCDIVAFQSSAANPTLIVTETGGGSVASDSGGISCSNGGTLGVCTTNTITSGTTVTLTENPAAGYSFTSWSGATCTQGQNSSQCTFVLNSNTTVTATWTASTTRTFVDLSGIQNVANKNIDSSPIGQKVPAPGSFTTVTITGGSNLVVYRCATSGTLPAGALTTNSGNCGTSTDTGMRSK